MDKAVASKSTAVPVFSSPSVRLIKGFMILFFFLMIFQFRAADDFGDQSVTDIVGAEGDETDPFDIMQLSSASRRPG